MGLARAARTIAIAAGLWSGVAPAHARDEPTANDDARSTDVRASVAAAPPAVPPSSPEPAYVARTRERTPALARYLGRDLAGSARFLDHGVIEVSGAGGYPHRYRIGASIGLLDHLTLGVTANWLPGMSRPRFAPRIALAFYRWRWFELGAVYDRTLYPATSHDEDPKTPSFQRDTHWLLTAFAFSQAWLSAGFEIGVARARETDPGKKVGDDNVTPARWVNRFGGGVFLRAGTRRWGFTASARAPWVFAELAFDLRFGAFELRPRGGWRPSGLARATDRRVPTRR